MATVMVGLAWVVGLGLATLVFQEWLWSEHDPNRNLEATGAGQVVLRQSRDGHYRAPGTINGTPVRFLLDTGATHVSVPAGVAREIGLERGAPVRTMTANGVITTYATRIDRLTLGDITVRDVAASVNPRMDGDKVLLGMSFLKRLELTQRGETLTLRPMGG
jgi:aspartyl protease family protein